MTVPPGVRPPAYSQHFETIETRVPAERIESAEPPADRADIAVIGPIAALVLALTISTLVLEHPAARTVAAALATLGLIVAVTLMLLAKRPERGRHVARHGTERRPE
ncbi:hypothetical protein [Lentzea nigeriaca]|uniref:hypothetical protein n=1 Tax=Lentzea nigeriaca TaxID=1128665 RepID=UPI00195E1A34|nr:hypothetical protein [Lentzea nigeriaca]MBM7856578.1 hypothetical protein [Lentzea nigeriaca]